MAIDPTTGSVIKLVDAQNFVNAFRVKFDSEIKGVFAGSDNINLILNQDDCIGIRMYFGIDEVGKLNLVLVGVDKFEKDMTEGTIVERLAPCPNDCDVTSDLY